jgi:hypothetical protein
MLKKLDLYAGKVIKELSNNRGFMCKCRHSHMFKYTTNNDWCNTCTEPEFQQNLIQSTNEALHQLESPFTIFQVNEFGIATFICLENHISQEDIDIIPNDCDLCKKKDCGSTLSAYDSKVWSMHTHNLNITHPQTDSTDSAEELDIEFNSENEKDDDYEEFEYMEDTDNEKDDDYEKVEYIEDTDNEDSYYEEPDELGIPEESKYVPDFHDFNLESVPRKVRQPVVLQKNNNNTVSENQNRYNDTVLISERNNDNYNIHPQENDHIEQAIRVLANYRNIDLIQMVTEQPN